MEKIIGILKDATSKMEALKSYLDTGIKNVTKVRMIDGLTGNVIHTATIHEEFPSDERIAKCERNMVSNYLRQYMRKEYYAPSADRMQDGRWLEFAGMPLQKGRKKVRDSLRYEVYKELE